MVKLVFALMLLTASPSQTAQQMPDPDLLPTVEWLVDRTASGVARWFRLPPPRENQQKVQACEKLHADARLAGIEMLRIFWNDKLQKDAVALFDSGDADIRLLAVETAGWLGRPRDRDTHESLLLHLRDEDRLVRQAVYAAIARINAEGAADVLVTTLQFDDGKVNGQRAALVRAIDSLGKPGIAKLLALADSGEKKDTDLVAEVFVTMRTIAAADGLPELLKNYHLSAEQKQSLIRSLKNYPLDSRRLLGWLDSRDAAFRLGVIREIAERNVSAAIPRLERLSREAADAAEAKAARQAIENLRARQIK
ncbi:MAG: HEAT repeat domain-containing protein [Planctomycetes bacterium]|nr:HEAT repeat domain-containing protein [Planctomycetota bacterium]